MIHISPRQLQVFAQVVATGSLRGAAGALHLTPPAASMALADMERLLGAPVFDREHGRLRLNPRGRELLPLAQELLERYAELERVATHGSHAGMLEGELRIGTSNTVGNYRVGELLGDFIRDCPRVSIRLRVGNTEDIANALLDHGLDVGCVEGPVVHPLLESRPWRDDALVVCVAPEHRLAGREALRRRDFADECWVLREPGSATRSLSEQALGKLPPPRRVLELSQTEAIKQAVVAGLGMAFLPEVAIVDAVASGRLVALDVPFLELRRTLSLLWHRRRYHGVLLDSFLGMVGLPA